jgi:hypothetical protein
VLLAVSFGYGMTGGGKLAQRIVQQAPGPSYVVVEPLDASDGAALPEVESRAPDAGSAVDADARDANIVEFTTEIGRVHDGRGVDGGVATVTVIAPVSPIAPPLQDEETWIGLPHEVSELVHPVGAPPGGLAEEDGEFLAALLARQDAAEGRLYALNSILDVFGSSGLDGLPTGDSEIDAAFAANDLSLIRFAETDFETLRRLNYPAFLTLRAADGQLHSVALLGLEDGIALLAGIGRSERLRVPISAVEARWTGEAAIAWRAFEDIPEMVTYGAEGSSVLWIQTSLARLGFLEPPGISGVYDVDTLGGVRAFQRGHRLEPDGVTGPMTQMLLYGALRDYAPPRLDEGEAG